MNTNDRIDGFRVKCVTPLQNLRSVAYELVHEATGAKILHLHNDDSENLFSVTFPTPPADDTGVAHILEHSVLAGSQKYRVKDPFFEMVKSSMATFINAMTAGDYTVYPVASNVRQDFYNLAEVYWDAVFHPLLTEKTFEREGHHLELSNREDLNSDLIIKGIVYNEMKGAKSSPESKVHDLLEKTLWADTPLGKDSGGDPDFIPDLTWQGLRKFHHTFYHPSNAYIFLYGDIPTADHLAFLKDRMAGFTHQAVDSAIPPQPRWSKPKVVRDVYPVAPTDPVERKTFVVLSWLVGDARDVHESFAMSALERILLGNQAAPLRKAMIDSKLGEDLTHSGYWANGVDTSFHIGLKGSEADRENDVVKLAMQALKKIADEGISQRQFDSALQQLAYRYLEITSQYPLHLMGWATSAWQHGNDPLALFYPDQYISKLKHEFAEDPKFFSRLIEDRLLNNPHRLTIVVQPDREAQARKDTEFKEKMRKRKEALNPRQIEAIALNQDALEAMLNEPNSPEAIASLPQLRTSDLPRKPRHISTTTEPLEGGGLLLTSDVFANGINYLHLSFDLTGLDPALYPYLSLFGDCVHKMGAAGEDYVSIAQRVAAYTGGVGFHAGTSTRVDDPYRLVRQATFTLRFLDDNAEAALELLHDLVFALDPSDVPRLKDVLLQGRAGQRMRATHDGLGLAMRHAARGLNTESLLGEITGGLPQIRLFEQIAEADVQPVMEKIDAIRKTLLNPTRITGSFTGSPGVHDLLKRNLKYWAAEMEPRPISDVPLGFTRWQTPPREGLAAPMNVAYCTMVMPAPHISHPDAPCLMVGGRLLGLGYVLEEIRFKGTAYGGGCGYNGPGQLWTFHSYRDPWVNRSLDVYAGALDYIRGADWTQGDVDRSIIGTAKEGERPIRPPQASGTALWRHLAGATPQRREALHEKLLGTTLKDVRRVLIEQLETHASQAAICVVSSREKLESANREKPDRLLEISDILK